MHTDLLSSVRRLVALCLLTLAVAACGSDPSSSEVAADPPTSTTSEAPEGSVPTDDGAPQPGDHWHVAYGINICGEWLPPLTDGPAGDVTGIHTHEDGLIHVHPFTSTVSGSAANLGAFAETAAMELGEGSMTLPDGRSFSDGDLCDGAPAELRVLSWDDSDDTSPEEVAGDATQTPFTDGGVVAMAFGDEDAEVPMPPWGANLEDPLAAEQGREPLVVDSQLALAPPTEPIS